MNTIDVLLQWGPHPGPHPGPHAPMGPTGGAGAGMQWGLWGMGGGLLTLVVLLLVAALVIGAVYALSNRRARESGADTDALGVLRRRYARGDIDDEEFERRRGRLDGGAS